MKHSIFHSIDASILSLMLFIGCVVFVILGKKIRDRFIDPSDHESKGGASALLGALFGLWAFLLAFTFNNASTRFDGVRTLMTDEASMIRTVVLRTTTFPDSLQQAFTQDLKKYLQARIDYYEYASDPEKFNKTKQDAAATGKSLWTQTVSVSRVPGFTLAGNNMMTALTSMFDVAAKRDALLMTGIPTPIAMLLFLIALVISFVGGFTSPVIKMKEWVVIAGFILLACLIIMITIDLARPMGGIIKPDVGQDQMIQLNELF